MVKSIIIFGSSGHAGVVSDIIQNLGYTVLGFLDDFKQRGEEIFGHKILGKIEDIVHFKNISYGIIGIGDNWKRFQIYSKIISLVPDFKFITAIHPSAVISKNTQIGEGTVIMPGVVVNNASVVSNFCILNTNSSLDHDGIMHGFSSLAPGVVTGGYVEIGEFSAVSLGANVKHKIKIGKHSVVGAGSLVLKDIADYTIAFGIPSKEIRKREVGEKYL